MRARLTVGVNPADRDMLLLETEGGGKKALSQGSWPTQETRLKVVDLLPNVAQTHVQPQALLQQDVADAFRHECAFSTAHGDDAGAVVGEVVVRFEKLGHIAQLQKQGEGIQTNVKGRSQFGYADGGIEGHFSSIARLHVLCFVHAV